MSERTRRRRSGPASSRLPQAGPLTDREVSDYTEAQAAAQPGRHALTAELVRGSPQPRRAVVVEPEAPVAHRVLADLVSLLWGEVRTLRDEQHAKGKLDVEDREWAAKLGDAVTKALREERQQAELEDWSRLEEAEILEMLPEHERAALLAANGSTNEEDDGDDR